MSDQKLVVTGSIAIDRIMNFSGQYTDIIHATAIDKLAVSVFLDTMQDSAGGVGANIAYTSALLGNRPVLLGSVGRDAAGYINNLKTIGVDTEHVYFSDLPTASFNVITDGSNRQVGGFYPGAMFDSDSLNFDEWDDDTFVVISPHDPQAMRRQVKQCKNRGMRMFYDIGQQITNADPADIADGVDGAELLIVNDYEFSALQKHTGRTHTHLVAHTPVVIVTHGELGSTIYGKDIQEPIEVKATKAKKTVDPTGAGDAYRAGFLHGYLNGLDVQTSAQIGSVCGAFAVENHGTQGHVFSPNDVAKRYADTYGKSFEINERNL